jgi:hemerythrin-like domain-containing protein
MTVERRKRMNPIQELKDEHRAIEGALHILESIAEAIETPSGRDDAQRMLDFLRVFADTCHHGKEERVLFPSLENIGVSRTGGPIGMMLHEHDIGRGHIRSMAEALKSFEEGDRAAGQHFRAHAHDYAALLRRHITKEDQVLFEIADQRLAPVTKGEIQAQFDRIERDVVGQGRHEAFHRLLDNLQEKYGGAH